jgi:arginase family enzyme
MALRATEEVWFRTDDAWDFLLEADGPVPPAVDIREEARALRFITTGRRIEAFAERQARNFRPFTLYGSGDFHHLTALWLRQFREPFHLLSFDNHPDWDIRPPRWSCGAWMNRALENPRVRTASVWGCGNFECNFPGRLLGNGRAARAGRLRVHPWAQPGQKYPAWLHPMSPESWKARFTEWTESIRGEQVYVTIDLDCLAAEAAFTNWENGRFTCDDLRWAIAQVRRQATILGGDLCGAWSQPRYATPFQRLAGWFDHPRVAAPSPAERAARQGPAYESLWRELAFGR